MQKELLDTELDLYKKMQAGEEVTELRRKYTELQLVVCFSLLLFLSFNEMFSYIFADLWIVSFSAVLCFLLKVEAVSNNI